MNQTLVKPKQYPYCGMEGLKRLLRRYLRAAQ
jgi:hypothetical protein